MASFATSRETIAWVLQLQGDLGASAESTAQKVEKLGLSAEAAKAKVKELDAAQAKAAKESKAFHANLLGVAGVLSSVAIGLGIATTAASKFVNSVLDANEHLRSLGVDTGEAGQRIDQYTRSIDGLTVAFDKLVVGLGAGPITRLTEASNILQTVLDKMSGAGATVDGFIAATQRFADRALITATGGAALAPLMMQGAIGSGMDYWGGGGPGGSAGRALSGGGNMLLHPLQDARGNSIPDPSRWGQGAASLLGPMPPPLARDEYGRYPGIPDLDKWGRPLPNYRLATSSMAPALGVTGLMDPQFLTATQLASSSHPIPGSTYSTTMQQQFFGGGMMMPSGFGGPGLSTGYQALNDQANPADPVKKPLKVGGFVGALGALGSGSLPTALAAAGPVGMVAGAIAGIAPTLGKTFDGLIKQVEHLPAQLVRGIDHILDALPDVIGKTLPDLVISIVGMIPTLVGALAEALPLIIKAALVDLPKALAEAIVALFHSDPTSQQRSIARGQARIGRGATNQQQAYDAFNASLASSAAAGGMNRGRRGGDIHIHGGNSRDTIRAIRKELGSYGSGETLDSLVTS